MGSVKYGEKLESCFRNRFLGDISGTRTWLTKIFHHYNTSFLISKDCVVSTLLPFVRSSVSTASGI